LTERTILAHCIYLSAHERSLLQSCGCAIAHCPSSNRFLQSGVMGLRQMMYEGFRIGLGTDVAGGYSLSLLNEAKEAVESSKTWRIMHRDTPLLPVTVEEAVWLATLGGARALGLDAAIGNFRVGKQADFIVCSDAESVSEYNTFAAPSHRLARLVYQAHPACVQHVVVQGTTIFERSRS
ncbi:MAG: amidohydrolase family protein, partial [Bacteroidota bacterium]|nr:amidohydrolase family protein [Candidatus Kapabacteria bacterium]MDW8219424.1 amidohydrolase family protein [Bacteroidota bacterium]